MEKPHTLGSDPVLFEYFDHAADLGIRVTAPSLPSLFATAAGALMAWIGPVPANASEHKMEVTLEAEDVAELLVRWLQEVLYLFHQRHAYLVRVVDMRITESQLEAILACREWDDAEYANYQEVKAVTYHQLHVTHSEAGWAASYIIDI